MARISHADQGRFPVPRLDSGRAPGARSGSFPGPGTTEHGVARTGNSGVVKLLLQVADDRARSLSRARSFHPTDEAQEYSAAPEGRGLDHPPWPGVLRLILKRQISTVKT